MPAKLGPAGKDMWALVWDACSSWLAVTDVPVVERYARLADERAHCQALIDRYGRTAPGSAGQPVTAPAVEQLRAIEASMIRHEAILGIGPLHRARLGIAVAEAAMAGDRMARRTGRALAAKDDPRIVDIDARISRSK